MASRQRRAMAGTGLSARNHPLIPSFEKEGRLCALRWEPAKVPVAAYGNAAISTCSDYGKAV